MKTFKKFINNFLCFGVAMIMLYMFYGLVAICLQVLTPLSWLIFLFALSLVVTIVENE